MAIKRIIARLDIKGPNLVKGIHLEGLRVLGNPQDYARYYSDNGADELFFMDVVASLYGRNSLHEVVTKTAKNTFIPLCVGGGLRTVDDIREVLKAGADKVCLNTQALQSPDFIQKASREFGSSTIVVAIEAIRSPDGKYYCFTDNGREETGVEVASWATRVQELGAGEIVLTSVDREGTGEGLDCELIELVANVSSVPLIVHGGAGKLKHLLEPFEKKYDIDALALASLLHYHSVEKIAASDTTVKEGNISFLASGKKNNFIESCSIDAAKIYLAERGVSVRGRAE